MNHTTRINLLVIEDVPITAMNLAGRLEGEGYRIVGSILDLDSFLAPLAENTTTTSLNLAMDALPMERSILACTGAPTIDQYVPLWNEAFMQMRSPGQAHLWEFSGIHLQNGVAEIDLPDHYDGPLIYLDGTASEEDRIAVSGTTTITVHHTPKP